MVVWVNFGLHFCGSDVIILVSERLRLLMRGGVVFTSTISSNTPHIPSFRQPWLKIQFWSLE